MDMTNFDPQSGSSQPDPAPTPAPQAQYPPYSGYPPHAGYAPPQGYAQFPAYSNPTGYAPYAMPPAPKPKRGKRTLVSLGAAAVAAALVLGGYGIGSAVNSHDTVAGSASGTNGGTSTGGSAGTGGFPNTFPGGTGGTGGQGGSTGNGSGSSSQSAGTTATSTQQAGIVTINSVLKYQNAESAGTGMILSSDGEILTNNHVVSGATSVTVTDESTGKSYKADVVGTSHQ